MTTNHDFWQSQRTVTTKWLVATVSEGRQVRRKPELHRYIGLMTFEKLIWNKKLHWLNKQV